MITWAKYSKIIFEKKLEVACSRQQSNLLGEAFTADVERIESVGEVRAFFQVALVRLARLFEAYLLLVKAFLFRLLGFGSA